MARCAFCNAETKLYANGTPICPKCDSERRLISAFKSEIEQENSFGDKVSEQEGAQTESDRDS
jgi:hypothetical protein